MCLTPTLSTPFCHYCAMHDHWPSHLKQCIGFSDGTIFRLYWLCNWHFCCSELPIIFICTILPNPLEWNECTSYFQVSEAKSHLLPPKCTYKSNKRQTKIQPWEFEIILRASINVYVYNFFVYCTRACIKTHIQLTENPRSIYIYRKCDCFHFGYLLSDRSFNCAGRLVRANPPDL